MGVPCVYRPDQGRLAGNATARKAVRQVRHGAPMALEESRDPAWIAPTPAALGGDAEGRDDGSRRVDAPTVARLVVVVDQAEINPGRLRRDEAGQGRDVCGVVAILRHGQMKEVDRAGNTSEDPGSDLSEDGRVLR